MTDKLQKAVQAIQADMTARSRDLHQHPEIGLEEKRSSGGLAD